METLSEKLVRLSKESENELREIGLGDKLKRGVTYTINYRAKQRLGQCCNKKNINISRWLLEIGSDKDIKNTIIHEILHTFDDAVGHKARWKYYARYVNNRTDYHITTTTDIDNIYKRVNEKRPLEKYEITCLGCGAVYYKSRLQRTTLNGYKCGHRRHTTCGCNRFKIIDTRENKILVNGVEK